MLVFGSFISSLLAKMTGNDNVWILMVAVPVGIWLVIALIRLVIYLLQQIQANAWDKQREAWILTEVKRGRRALQILFSEFSTATTIPVSDQHESDSPLEILISNTIQIRAQRSWKGEDGVIHSRFTVNDENISPEIVLSKQLSNLIHPLSELVNSLSGDGSIDILFETETSLSSRRLQDLWQRMWRDSNITQSVTYVEEHGLRFIDRWLDQRIHDDALLLVISLQIVPQQPEGTAEAVAALLLGNRLTQKTLAPRALLHRPEKSPTETLEEGALQAMDWVPLPSDALKHLWLSGLSDKQHRRIMELQGKPPLVAINSGSHLYNIDSSLGHAGCAAPWLAIAAAAQIAELCGEAQMILSSEQGSDDVWSTVVTSYTTQQEKLT
ncbi:hypothetical protein [Budvicia diplopodorum]|uniref:hypothetical protein n=1 Tax=Budvicia diplopodorum TaxID=1119056 RepID=UPI001FEA5B9F|nr:hypothetical protein [Budvicia diplopodorum]